jgi:Holliday junction resolvase RusA-like endonuclease
MTITVFGTPAPQGSKRFVGHAKSGRGIMIESSAAVKPWREAVKWAALQKLHEENRLRINGPVRVRMVFTLPRPKSAKMGALPSKKPDLSKLVRATEDALTDAGMWEDDARVVVLEAQKLYIGHESLRYVPGQMGIRLALGRPGCVITIEGA